MQINLIFNKSLINYNNYVVRETFIGMTMSALKEVLLFFEHRRLQICS